MKGHAAIGAEALQVAEEQLGSNSFCDWRGRYLSATMRNGMALAIQPV